MTGPDATREKVLQAALPLIAEDGFTADVVRRAGEACGLSAGEIENEFPHGAADLVEAFSIWADAEMAAAIGSPPEGKLRDRIKVLVRARIEALVPHKAAARRAAAFLALPQHVPLAAKLGYRTVDAMWHAAGDHATDFSFYTKRAILAGVHGATLLYWLSDSSAGNVDTWTFLDKRIDEVMEFEKIKAQLRKATSSLPDPFKILGTIRAAIRPRWR